MDNLLKNYNEATKKLMQIANQFGDLPSNNGFNLAETVLRLRESFKYALTYKKVFDDIRPINSKDPSSDYCKVSSYYIYKNYGESNNWDILDSEREWVRLCLQLGTQNLKKVHCSQNHWFLVHKQSNTIFDITYTQFENPKLYYREATIISIPDTKKEDPNFIKELSDMACILGKTAGLNT